MVVTSYYHDEEVKKIGFKKLGKCVLISRKTSIYSPDSISVGNNVRIDDFCILSGNINIGNHVHIASGCYLFGNAGIVMEDFSAISSRSAIYSSTDDYCGDYYTNPTVADEFRHIISGQVVLKQHVIIGTGCTILPAVTLGEGVAVGAMSLVNKSLDGWKIYAGVPAKVIKERSKKLKGLKLIL